MRVVNVEKRKLVLKDDGIVGFLERVVTPIGTSGKADVPKRFMGHRVYVIITSKKVKK